jgi:hypothetical protein
METWHFESLTPGILSHSQLTLCTKHQSGNTRKPAVTQSHTVPMTTTCDSLTNHDYYKRQIELSSSGHISIVTY